MYALASRFYPAFVLLGSIKIPPPSHNLHPKTTNLRSKFTTWLLAMKCISSLLTYSDFIMSSSTQLEDMSSSTTTELNPANPYPKLPKVRGDLRSLVRRIGFRKWVKQVEFLNEECGGITRSQAQHEWKRLLLKKKKLYGGSTEQKRRLLEEGNVQVSFPPKVGGRDHSTIF